MKIERKKNAVKNIAYGSLLKLYQILVPFLMRSAIIYFMGVQYAGLSGLFNSILQVLNLAELGVGSAMIYSMYRPIAEDDTESICALMALYRKYYHVIGLIIAIVGILLVPFISHFIAGEIPLGINVYALYVMNLAGTVLSYWLMAYKASIFYAHQRTDIISRIMLVVNSVQYLLQFYVLWKFKDYYMYVIISVVMQAVANVSIAFTADKRYPQYKAAGVPEKRHIHEITGRIRDLFSAKLGSVVLGAADTIVISAFLGLQTLAIYQNYYFVMNSVCGFITVLFSSVTAGFGNSLVMESNEKNYDDFNIFTFIVCWILCICSCCFCGLYQPFMKLWVGEKLTLPYGYVILFCVYFYVCELSMVWATMKDAAGMWHEDRFRPLIGSMANLIMNIILVQRIGLSGVLLSTIISYIFISMPWLVYNLFKYLYSRSCKEYILKIAKYCGVTVVSCFLCIYLCVWLDLQGLFALIVNLVICIVVSNFLQIFLLSRQPEFKKGLLLIRNMLKKR